MQQLIGQSLDSRYRIDSLLGEGDKGPVYKAFDTKLELDRAVKVIRPEYARLPGFQERLEKEAQTLARLSHPGLVEVHYVGQDESYSYIVMDFILGPNLRHRLDSMRREQGKWIPFGDAVWVVQQAGTTLDYLHQHGVLGQSVSPDNIMLKDRPGTSPGCQPVLTDLGLARLLAEGDLAGTVAINPARLAYMSPEQALGEEMIDERSDVYSLGVLLYELTTARPPLKIGTKIEAVRYHGQEQPTPPGQVRPNFPSSLDEVILQALSKNPADRFPSARALVEALAGVDSSVAKADADSEVAKTTLPLVTEDQERLLDVPFMTQDLPEEPAITGDYIQVRNANGGLHSLPIPIQGLTIGREVDNGLVLDSPEVSRHHARLILVGTEYHVEDLVSANGTYLGKTKLAPGTPEPWAPDQMLRIGAHYLRLQLGGIGEAQSTIFRADGTRADPSLIYTSFGEQRVAIYMEATEISAQAGESVTTSFTIKNQGKALDHFRVSVAGIPDEWVLVTRPVSELKPGAQQEVALIFQVPRSPDSQAGRYPLTFRVDSQGAPDQVAEVEANLTVAPYVQFQAELYPQRMQVGQQAVVAVENQGNQEQTFQVTWRDRGNELSFEPDQAELSVKQGEVTELAFSAALLKEALFGDEHVHPIVIKVSAPGADSQSIDGEVVSKGRIPLNLAVIGIIVAIVMPLLGILTKCVGIE